MCNIYLDWQIKKNYINKQKLKVVHEKKLSFLMTK